MAWSEKPTYAQLEVAYRWMSWRMPIATAKAAIDWLEKKADRKQMSAEMGRIKKLYREYNLSEETCFVGEVWEGFEYEKEENETDAK